MNKAGKTGDKGDFSNRFVAQVFIFQGEDYLGWDCFYKDKISIGRSENADLVLRDDTLSDIQANVYFKGDQVIVSDQTKGRGVFVNNKAFKTVILGPLDYVDIGPYTIKVKLRKNETRFSDLSKIEQDTGKEEVINKDNASGKEDTQTRLFLARLGTKDHTDEQNEKSSIEWPDAEKIPEDPIKNEPGITPQHDSSEKDQVVTKESPEDDPAHQKETNNGKNNIENIKTQESGDFTDKGQDLEKGRYRLIFEGKIKESLNLEDVKKKLTGLLKTSKSRIEKLFSGKQVTIKKDTDYKTAVKLKDSLEKAGAIARVEPSEETDLQPEIKIPKETDVTDSDKDSEALTEDDIYEQTIKMETKPFVSTPTYIEEDDEEEEEEDREDINNLYFLKDKLTNVRASSASSSEYRPTILEVLKYRNKVLIDVCFLNENEKYYIGSGKDKFCLAEHDSKKEFFFYFSKKYDGIIRTSGSTISETANLQIPEKLFHNKKGIYQDAIPKNGEVIISDGTFEYLLRQVAREESVKIKDLPQKEKIYHKFLLKSALIHLFLVIAFGLYSLIPNSIEAPPETHFVKIETDELLELKKKLTPPSKPKPKVKPKPKMKPQVVKVEPQKKQPVKKSTRKPQKVASAKSTKTKYKGKQGVSRHPDAGGGFGKGNIKNRNINQTGLLSMIGDSVSLKPQVAMAAVTNLDAVSSTRGSEGNFKVSGIVGKLGNAKIEIPKSGGIVSTKGSTQVLRSAGARGKGRVAALEKGKIGQKQVMGMVSAKLTRTVRIRGGMSREAVKRVIDQHLDEISYCYETALIANPSIMGKVIFEWKILISGKVGEIKIKSSSINSSEIHSCIKSAIKTWQFPKPKGSEVVVSYPFIFDIVGF